MKRFGSKLCALVVCGAMAVWSCKGKGPPPQVTTASASARVLAAAPRALGLVSAEQRRDSRAITSADLSSRDVSLRRLAARALARIADARSHELLTAALADEDREVVAWSAYGLGYACLGRETRTVPLLVMRAVTLNQQNELRAPQTGSELDPLLTIIDALGRCANDEAAQTLTNFLERPSAEARAAALALGRVAARRGKLPDRTLVALLDAETRAKNPLDTALYPFTRLGALSASVQTRLLEVAKQALKQPGMRQSFAVRAFGKVGEAGSDELASVLTNGDYPPNLRAEAARELGKLGEPGQRILSAALVKLELTPGASANELLRSANWGALSALLSALTPPVRDGRDVLTKLAEFPIDDHDDNVLRRRKVAIRCSAAQLLAGRATLAPKLVACDPEPEGRLGLLATINVLERGKLDGARLKRFQELAESKDPVVRKAALKLLPSHPEVTTAYAALASALAGPEPGTIATAAQILATYPDRSVANGPQRAAPDADSAPGAATPMVNHVQTLRPHESVIRGLTQAYDAALKTPQIEVRAALIDAAAALELLGLKPRIEQDCKSDNPTLREHAEKALHLLGDKTRVCDSFEPPVVAPREAVLPQAGTVTLTLDTEVGELSLVLSRQLAPGAVLRITELAKTGFYDNIAVHRVVPGFVVQFGDPRGDGFGGADRPALRCETSPVSFTPGSVGLALAGRDTGSSQLFVTLGRYPHLDGEYPWLGTASAGFERLAEGDLIRKVTVKAGG